MQGAFHVALVEAVRGSRTRCSDLQGLRESCAMGRAAGGMVVARLPVMKKVLVAFGSLRGGTEGIAVEVARTLRQSGLDVDCKPVTESAAILKAPDVAARVAAPPARWLLATLCAAVALTAIAGGGALVLAPDGSLIHASRALLEPTPFTSFLVPGAILLVVVGLANALATARVLRDLPSANPTAVVAGVALFGWIVGEMVMLHTVEPVQLGYLVVALAIVGEALRRRAREPAQRVLGTATR